MIDKNALTIEELGRGGYKLYQPKDGFRYGTDTVLLAWFAASFLRKSAKATKCPQRVLELGAGVGTASILVQGRFPGVLSDAVEIEPIYAEVLKENIALNNLENKMRGFNADIRQLPLDVKSIQYDVVMFNPPFFTQGSGPKTLDHSDGKLGARFEENGSLNDFIATAASRVIPSKGYIVLVMHASRLNDVLVTFACNNIKATHIMSVHPFVDKGAEMVLVAGKRGASGTDVKVMPPLILNERTDGGIIMTSKIKEIYEEEHRDCFI
ncbi:MAG: methyltransferase [Saccharofermentans sp.]|nr:methyltransferase [Saccharofermentans sp.]